MTRLQYWLGWATALLLFWWMGYGVIRLAIRDELAYQRAMDVCPK